MYELYELIEQKIKASGYPREISGEVAVPSQPVSYLHLMTLLLQIYLI